MVAPASFNSISVAGQQATQQIGNGNKSSKRASMFLSLRRRENSQNILDLNLGSPFLFEDVFSGLTPSPRSLEFKLSLPSAVAPSSPLPLFSSFVEPFDAFDDSESDASDSEDEEDDTQYISIPSTSPFYHPPPKPRSFDFAPWSESCSSSSSMSFACDALSEDVGESAAILFHEKLDGISYVRDDVFIVDDEFLHEAGTELYVSPFDVYQDMYLDMLKNPVGFMSLHDEDPCPDVPVDFDEEDAHAEMYSGILPVTLEPVTVTSSVGRQSPLLNRRLVAPFEEAEAQLRNRASVVPPSSLFCGLFPQTNTAMRN